MSRPTHTRHLADRILQLQETETVVVIFCPLVDFRYTSDYSLQKKNCFPLKCCRNMIPIGKHLHIKNMSFFFLNWRREISEVPLQLILPSIHERFIAPRRDPDVVVFYFISHNSFHRLPFSLLQQCLREVWNSPYEIRIHPMCFTPNRIISRYLVVYTMEAKIYMWKVLTLDKGFAAKRAFLFLRWQKPCLAVSAM